MWITAFADDIALALRKVFRDLRIFRRTLDVVGFATALRLNLRKSVVINSTRRSHVMVQDIACEGNGFLVSGSGRYLGFILGLKAHVTRWAAVHAKYLARAAHVNLSGFGDAEFRWPTMPLKRPS